MGPVARIEVDWFYTRLSTPLSFGWISIRLTYLTVGVLGTTLLAMTALALLALLGLLGLVLGSGRDVAGHV